MVFFATTFVIAFAFIFIFVAGNTQMEVETNYEEETFDGNVSTSSQKIKQINKDTFNNSEKIKFSSVIAFAISLVITVVYLIITSIF